MNTYFTKERRYFIQCLCGAYDWVYESDLASGKKRGCGVCLWNYTPEEKKDVALAESIRKRNKANGIPRQQQSIYD
jgi:hypothetical protein